MRLAETRGWRAKAALLLREAFPSPTFMRLRSNRSELAQRGRAGLVAAYVLRLGDLIRAAGAGYRHARGLRDDR